jgi:cysteine desulfurase
VIYLDHAATSPVLAEVADAMAAWVGVPANPSSVHGFGRRAAAAVDRARDEVAALLGRDPAGVVFGSGATEANHTAIRGFARLGAVRVLASPLEHPSVEGALIEAGVAVARLEVGSDGIVRVPARIDADLVVLQAVNHEIGTVQPVRAFGGVRLHVDATQAAGRIDLHGIDADSVAISAHKIGGPVGVGALSLRDGAVFPGLLTGGGQERGRRAGTVDVAGVVGFGVAARLAREGLEERHAHHTALADRLRSGLVALGGRIVGVPGIPAITTAVFGDLRGETVVQALDLRGIAVSSGAACASGSVGPSPVLRAIGDPNPRGGVRISLGPLSSEGDIDAVLIALGEVIPALGRARDAWVADGD